MYICIHTYIDISLSLYMCVCIYIYIYIYCDVKFNAETTIRNMFQAVLSFVGGSPATTQEDREYY